jgi:hypothetical protein
VIIGRRQAQQAPSGDHRAELLRSCLCIGGKESDLVADGAAVFATSVANASTSKLASVVG